MLAIAYLPFAPLERPPGTSSDKLNHILAFWVLAWFADKSYPGPDLEPYRWALLMGHGLVIELVQGFLPFREFSLLHLAADAAGILCYKAAVWMRRSVRARSPTANTGER